MNTRNNRKFQENAALMEEACLELIEEKKKPVITVREICEAAHVNRSTFYRHYLDVDDLLEKTCWYVMQDFFARIPDSGETAEQEEILSYIRQDVLRLLLEHIQRYRIFYVKYFERRGAAVTAAGLGNLWDEYFVPMFREISVTESRHMRYYFSFFQAGLMTTIRTWLEDGCPETPEVLSEIIINMMRTDQLQAGKHRETSTAR